MTRSGIVLFLTLSCFPAAAFGQTAESSEKFQLQTLDYGMRGTSIFGVATSAVPDHLDLLADVVLEYASRPAVATTEENGEVLEEFELVDDRWMLDLGLGLGLGPVQLDLRNAVTLAQTGSGLGQTSPDAAVSSFAFGDLRLGGTVRILDRNEHVVGFAARATLWMPTGKQGAFASDGSFRFEPRLVVDRELGPVLLVANAAYQFRPRRQAANYRSDDIFRFGVAARTPIGAGLGVDAGLFGSASPFNDPDPTSEGSGLATTPVEAIGGISWSYQNFEASAAVGTGLTSGVGAPRVRALVALAYRPSGAPGRAGSSAGRTARGSSGKKGLDTDADGIADELDQCPYEAEDADEFEDEDGCPDDDDDGDGVLDLADACRLEAGVPEKSGCPIADRDADGIDDSVDECADEPEDIDQFDDADGCPEADNDGDGIVDAEDQCPNDAEVINGNEDTDGCPDEGAELVSIDGDRIQILERVYFDSNRSTIKQRSFAVLEQVAAVLANHPEIAKLAIEGHTDDVGSATGNLDLATRRAGAVKAFLESRGVDAARLTHRGYGESHPIDTNDTAEGRAANRRVEFLILSTEGTK